MTVDNETAVPKTKVNGLMLSIGKGVHLFLKPSSSRRRGKARQGKEEKRERVSFIFWCVVAVVQESQAVSKIVA